MPKNKTYDALRGLVKTAEDNYAFFDDFINKNSVDLKSNSDILIEQIGNNRIRLINESLNQIDDLKDFEKTVIKNKFNEIIKKDTENGTDTFSFSKEDFDCPYVEQKTQFTFEEFNNIPKNIDSEVKLINKGGFEVKEGVSNKNDFVKEIKFEKKDENVKYEENKYFNYKFFDVSKIKIGVNEFKEFGIKNGDLYADRDYKTTQAEIDKLNENVEEYLTVLAFNKQIDQATDELTNLINSNKEVVTKYKKFLDSEKFYSTEGTLVKKNSFANTINEANEFIEKEPIESFGETIAELQTQYKYYLIKKHKLQRESDQISDKYPELLENKDEEDGNHVIDGKLKEYYNSIQDEIFEINTHFDAIRFQMRTACQEINSNEYEYFKKLVKKPSEVDNVNYNRDVLIDAFLTEAEYESYLNIKEDNEELSQKINEDESQINREMTDRYFGEQDGKIFKDLVKKDIVTTNKKILDLQGKLNSYSGLLEEFSNRNFTNKNIHIAFKCEIEEGLLDEEISLTNEERNKLIEEEKQKRGESLGVNVIEENENEFDEIDKDTNRFVYGINAGLEVKQRKAKAALDKEKNELAVKNLFNINNFQIRNIQLYDASLSRRKVKVANSFNEAIKDVIPQLTELNKNISDTKKIISSNNNRNNFLLSLTSNKTNVSTVYNKLFKPFKKTNENLCELKSEIKQIKDGIFSLNEISEIANETSNLPFDENTLKKLKDSLDYVLTNEEDKNLVEDYLYKHEQLQEAAVDASNANAFFTSTGNASEYNMCLGLCRLKCSPDKVNSLSLTEKVNKIEEVYFANGFDLDKDHLKSFGKDENIGRLARNIGLYQGVTNLIASLPVGKKYKKSDSGSYNDQLDRLNKLKTQLRTHLVNAYPIDKSEELDKILSHVVDANCKNKSMQAYVIQDLFDKVPTRKDGPLRRDAYAEALRNQFVAVDTKQQCIELAKAYQIAVNTSNNFKDYCREISNDLDSIKESYAKTKKDYERVSKRIEQDKLFDNYHKQYTKYKSQNFFKRLFDGKGRRDLERTANSIALKYNFSLGVLDIIKYGKTITGSKLRSCIKDCEYDFPELDIIQKTIYENNLYTDKKVMKAYSDFCKKGKFTPQKALFDCAKTAENEKKNIEIEDKRIIAAEIARKQKEELDKKANKQNVQENNQEIQQENVEEDEELKRTGTTIENNHRNLDDTIDNQNNLRSNSLIEFKRSIVLESLNTVNNIGEQENVNQVNNQQLVNENLNQHNN